MTAITMLGHNNPPEPTPFEAAAERIDTLFMEAKHWLDGNEAGSQAEADAIGKLMDMVRAAKKDADAKRAEEKRPHDEAAKAVQEKYRPLLTRADLMVEGCKAAITPWLMKIEAEKRAREDAARKEAEAKALAAQEAVRAAQAADLEAREKAEALLRDAKKAEAAATKATNDKAHAKGGARAVTLRTSYDAEVTDMQAFARWAWGHRQADLAEFLDGLAKRVVAAGVRDIPGVTVHEIKTAV